jgi:putative ABC transport system ATP-binding protein
MGDTTVVALDAVDCEIARGSFVVILGPSGSGKSTMLNLIGGLDAVSVGEVDVDGRNITSLSRRERFSFRRSTVSFIFQTFNLLSGLTAAENVQFGADVAGRGDAWGRASRALDDGARRSGNALSPPVVWGRAAACRHCPSSRHRKPVAAR